MAASPQSQPSSPAQPTQPKSPKLAKAKVTNPLAPGFNAAPVKLRVTLVVDEQMYDIYAERAAKFNRNPEDEMLLRLHHCISHTSTQPLYLNDEERSKLSQILGHGLSTPDDLFKHLRNIVMLRLGKTDIALEERLLTRLHTRHFNKGETFPEFLKRIVIEQLEAYVGMR